jgi:hypothetical protein
VKSFRCSRRPNAVHTTLRVKIFRLAEVGHGPLLVVLAGLCDLVVLVVLTSQRPSVRVLRCKMDV